MNKRLLAKLFVLISLILSSPLSAKDLASIYPPEPRAQGQLTNKGEYIVALGDTIYGISRRLKVSPKAIINIVGKDAIFSGQIIVLDTLNLAAPQIVQKDKSKEKQVKGAAGEVSQSEGLHVVQSGDTLWGLARRYKIPLMVLSSANNLPDDSQLKIGQKIMIPTQNMVQSNKPKREEKKTKTVSSASNAQIPVQNNVPKGTAQSAKVAKPSTTQPKEKTSKHSGLHWPIRGNLLEGFGLKEGGVKVDGITIAAAAGMPVVASDDGVVIHASDSLENFGELLLIQHAGGLVTAYAHNERLLVKEGERVSRGQKIALSGQSGAAKRPQVHFQVRLNGDPVNPLNYLGN